MKKLITLLFIIISLGSFGQTFPNQPTQANTSTNNQFLGAITGQKGIKGAVFSDTTAANASPFVKGTPFIIIATTADKAYYFRNSDTMSWIQFLPSGGGTGQRAWLISGNNGVFTSPTDPQYVGTLTNQPFGMYSHGIARLTFNTSGAWGVGSGLDYGSAGQFLQSNGNAASPTWGAVAGTNIYNSDGTIGADRTVSGNGKLFTWNNTNGWILNSTDDISLTVNTSGSSQISVGDNTLSAAVSFAGKNSQYDLYPDSIVLRPGLGNFRIDSLNAGSSSDSILTWNKTTGQLHRVSPSSIATATPVFPAKQVLFGTGTGTTSSSKLQFDSAASPAQLTVDNTAHDARVGINTLTPDSTLKVIGSIYGTSSVRFTGLLAAANAGDSMVVVNTATGNLGYRNIPSSSVSAPNTEIVFGTGSGVTSSSNFTFDDVEGIAVTNSYSRAIQTTSAGLFNFGDYNVDHNGNALMIDDAGNSIVLASHNFGYAASKTAFAVQIGDYGGGNNNTWLNIDDANQQYVFKSSGATVTIENLSGTGTRIVQADASGVLSAPVSDLRYKENIKPITNSVDVIALLRDPTRKGIFYNMKGSKEIEIGMGAQMFSDIQGMTGTMKATGKMYLNYDRITAILWEQNRILLQKNDALEERLKKLEEQVSRALLIKN